MATHLEHLPPDYGPPPQAQGPYLPYSGPPQYARLPPYNEHPQHGPHSPDYGPPQHDLLPPNYDPAQHGPLPHDSGTFQHGPRSPEYGPPQHNSLPPDYGPHPPDYGPHPPDYGPQTPDYGPHPPDYGPHPPDYGPHPPDYGPHPTDYGPHPTEYNPPQHGPRSPHNGPPAQYIAGDHAFYNTQYYNEATEHRDGYYPYDSSHQHEFENLQQPPAPEYSTEGSESEEPEDDEDWDVEEEDDDSVIFNNLEEALQEVNIQLPRLAVTAPPSVVPPKGKGLCRLPNLGSTCYLNAVLQCLYHTPGLPALLAQACRDVGSSGGGRNTVAGALNSIMTKMDDVKRLKRGVLAYFKGVCGLRDEQFAGEGQQEAFDLLAGLLLWLHQDLASQEEVDCVCTKNSVKKRSTTTNIKSNDSKKNHHATPQGSTSHHQHHQERRPPKQPPQQQSYQYRPPASQRHPPNFQIFTGSDHDYSQHSQPSDHQSSSRDQDAPTKMSKEGEVCGQCGVTYQRRSLISDVFEGIRQQDIICPKGGIILTTTWERFTSLSLPVTGSSEITLEEALQQYFKVSTFLWDCDYCGSSHPCHQQTRILCAPPILVLHLSRYTDRRSPRKQSVDFPLAGLSLQGHIKSSKGRAQQYGLYGMCNHHGTVQQGHYTACCRTDRSQDSRGSWHLFDDVELQQVDEKHCRHLREAHILFYSTRAFEAMHS